MKNGKSFLILLLLAAITGACTKSGQPATAVAQFTYATDTSSLGSVDFTNSSKNATSYLWNFGDSTTSTLASPAHNFPSNGTYYVTLTPYNSSNAAGTSQTQSVVVTNGPTFTALMQGSSDWSYSGDSYAYAKTSANLITVYSASTDGEQVWFSLPLNVTAGTFNQNANSLVSFNYDCTTCSPSYGVQSASSSLSCSSGTVTVTSVSQTQIKGTFSCYVVTNCYSGYNWLAINNGQFAVRFQ